MVNEQTENNRRAAASYHSRKVLEENFAFEGARTEKKKT